MDRDERVDVVRVGRGRLRPDRRPDGRRRRTSTTRRGQIDGRRSNARAGR